MTPMLMERAREVDRLQPATRREWDYSMNENNCSEHVGAARSGGAKKTRPRRLPTVRRWTLSVVAIAAVAAGVQMVAAPAEASVSYCNNYSCTVYLSKSETRAIASGQVPGASSVPAGPLRTAYYAMVYGHRWFAGQYANQGMCSAFTLDIRPWARQGYWGYSCNWN